MPCIQEQSFFHSPEPLSKPVVCCFHDNTDIQELDKRKRHPQEAIHSRFRHHAFKVHRPRPENHCRVVTALQEILQLLRQADHPRFGTHGATEKKTAPVDCILGQSFEATLF